MKTCENLKKICGSAAEAVFAKICSQEEVTEETDLFPSGPMPISDIYY